MLRKETVSAVTLELLNVLMKDSELQDFFLVGGTALSLQIGHRMSIDIDLFSQNPFDENKLLAYLENQYRFQLDYIDRNTVKGQINGVKVDLITHAYALVMDVVLDESIRLASLEDIAAMKLNAIVGNGTRLKDFVDIAFLSSFLSLEQMTSAYEKKYQSRNPVIIMKALSYHQDINFNEPIHYISGAYPWKSIERRISKMVNLPHQVFQEL